MRHNGRIFGVVVAAGVVLASCGYDAPTHSDWYEQGRGIWCFDTEGDRAVATTCVTADSNPGGGE